MEDTVSTFIKNNMNKKNFNQICEMGCGTGYLSLVMMNVLPNSSFVLIDNNENAVKLAQENITLNQKEEIN